MFNPTHHPQTFRQVPLSATPISKARIEELLEVERVKFTARAPKSGEENLRAGKVTPLGVASSFQHWDPYPISIVSAKGAWMKDVDGRDMLDLSMGFGALLVGHLNDEVIKEAKETLEVGTLFATPSPITRDGAEIICRRFGIDMVRFANSGTEATMYAIRTARAATGKLGIVKIEGGYHGSYDPLMVSAKPKLDQAGPASEPNSV
ncbi:MAG: aminotransferase class III-fold pyridoxal phosphate-dependent enzyme, partial [Actinomycetota bacterium]